MEIEQQSKREKKNNPISKNCWHSDALKRWFNIHWNWTVFLASLKNNMMLKRVELLKCNMVLELSQDRIKIDFITLYITSLTLNNIVNTCKAHSHELISCMEEWKSNEPKEIASNKQHRTNGEKVIVWHFSHELKQRYISLGLKFECLWIFKQETDPLHDPLRLVAGIFFVSSLVCMKLQWNINYFGDVAHLLLKIEEFMRFRFVLTA